MTKNRFLRSTALPSAMLMFKTALNCSLKFNIIRADKNFHIKLSISHGVSGNNWVNMDWDALSLGE